MNHLLFKNPHHTQNLLTKLKIQFFDSVVHVNLNMTESFYFGYVTRPILHLSFQ